jgi:hypothetical protein
MTALELARSANVLDSREHIEGFPEELSMQKARLLSTAAATLLLTLGAASAQAPKKDEAPAPAPAAQQKAPAEKVAPAMNAGKPDADTHKLPDTNAQAPKASDAGKTRATDKAATDKEAVDKSTAKPAAAETKSTTDTKSATDTKNATPAASGATTGQGAAGAAKLSTEQRTKITTAIKKQSVKPVQLNISVRVGASVPSSVHFYPLPTEVVEVYPEWRGYDFILVGNEIIILNPGSHTIVAILEA